MKDCDKKMLDNGRQSMVTLEKMGRTAADLRRHAIGLAKAVEQLEEDIRRERSHADK